MLGLEKRDREYEKKIEEFAKETINEVEIKSKMFGTTVNSIANVNNVRKRFRREYRRFRKKDKRIKPIKCRVLNAKKNIL